ncbi:MAG TPA: hypothetical protein VF177_10775, partial [Anaerolineae bacterium]
MLVLEASTVVCRQELVIILAGLKLPICFFLVSLAASSQDKDAPVVKPALSHPEQDRRACPECSE